MKSVNCKCGHPQAMFDRATPEEMARQSLSVCENCRCAVYSAAHPRCYDARIGAYVTEKTSREVARITTDPTAFVIKPDYAPNENVRDGQGSCE